MPENNPAGPQDGSVPAQDVKEKYNIQPNDIDYFEAIRNGESDAELYNAQRNSGINPRLLPFEYYKEKYGDADGKLEGAYQEAATRRALLERNVVLDNGTARTPKLDARTASWLGGVGDYSRSSVSLNLHEDPLGGMYGYIPDSVEGKKQLVTAEQAAKGRGFFIDKKGVKQNIPESSLDRALSLGLVVDHEKDENGNPIIGKPYYREPQYHENLDRMQRASVFGVRDLYGNSLGNTVGAVWNGLVQLPIDMAWMIEQTAAAFDRHHTYEEKNDGTGVLGKNADGTNKSWEDSYHTINNFFSSIKYAQDQDMENLGLTDGVAGFGNAVGGAIGFLLPFGAISKLAKVGKFGVAGEKLLSKAAKAAIAESAATGAKLSPKVVAEMKLVGQVNALHAKTMEKYLQTLGTGQMMKGTYDSLRAEGYSHDDATKFMLLTAPLAWNVGKLASVFAGKISVPAMQAAFKGAGAETQAIIKAHVRENTAALAELTAKGIKAESTGIAAMAKGYGAKFLNSLQKNLNSAKSFITSAAGGEAMLHSFNTIAVYEEGIAALKDLSNTGALDFIYDGSYDTIFASLAGKSPVFDSQMMQKNKNHYDQLGDVPKNPISGRPILSGGLLSPEGGIDWGKQSHILESAFTMSIASGIMQAAGGTFFNKKAKDPMDDLRGEAINKYIVQEGGIEKVFRNADILYRKKNSPFGSDKIDEHGDLITEDNIGKVKSQKQVNYERFIEEMTARKQVYDESGLKEFHSKWKDAVEKGSKFDKEGLDQAFAMRVSDLMSIDNVIKRGIDVALERKQIGQKLAELTQNKDAKPEEVEALKKAFEEKDAEYKKISSDQEMGRRFRESMVRANQKEFYSESYFEGDFAEKESLQEMLRRNKFVEYGVVTAKDIEQNNSDSVSLQAQRERERQERLAARQEFDVESKAFEGEFDKVSDLSHNNKKAKETLDSFDEIVSKVKSHGFTASAKQSLLNVSDRLRSVRNKLYEEADKMAQELFLKEGNTNFDEELRAIDAINNLQDASESQMKDLTQYKDRNNELKAREYELNNLLKQDPAKDEAPADPADIRREAYTSMVTKDQDGNITTTPFLDLVESYENAGESLSGMQAYNKIAELREAIAKKQRSLLLSRSVYNNLKPELSDYKVDPSQKEVIDVKESEVSEEKGSINNHLTDLYDRIQNVLDSNASMQIIDRHINDAIYAAENLANRSVFSDAISDDLIARFPEKKSAMLVLKGEVDDSFNRYIERYNELFRNQDPDRKPVTEDDVKSLGKLFLDTQKKMVAFEDSVHKELKSNPDAAKEIYLGLTLEKKKDGTWRKGIFGEQEGTVHPTEYRDNSQYMSVPDHANERAAFIDNAFLLSTRGGKNGSGLLLSEFTNYYNNLVRISPLNFYYGYNKVMDLMKKNKQESGNLTRYFGESVEQMEAVKHIVSFLLNPKNVYAETAGISPGLWKYNSLLAQGFAGSGKSKEVLPMAIAVYDALRKFNNEGEGKITLVSLTGNLEASNAIIDKLANIDPKLKERTGNTAVSYDLLMKDENVEKPDLIIIDEATILSGDQIQALQAKFGLNEAGGKTKIIFAGDSSQLSNFSSAEQGTVIAPPILSGIEKTTPMTQVMRSDIYDISLVQAAFRKVSFPRFDTVQKPAFISMSHTKDRREGVYARGNSKKSEAEQMTQFVNDIKDPALRGSTVMIVLDQAHANEMIDNLSMIKDDSGRFLATKDELRNYVRPILAGYDNSAVGFDFGRVYVNIKNDASVGILYNRVMLTALTRAEKFIDFIADETDGSIESKRKAIDSYDLTKEQQEARQNNIIDKFDSVHNNVKEIVEYGKSKSGTSEKDREIDLEETINDDEPPVEPKDGKGKTTITVNSVGDIKPGNSYKTTKGEDISIEAVYEHRQGKRKTNSVDVKFPNGEIKNMSMTAFKKMAKAGKIEKPVFGEVFGQDQIDKDVAAGGGDPLSRVIEWSRRGIRVSQTYAHTVDVRKPENADYLRVRKWALQRYIYGPEVNNGVRMMYYPEKTLFNEKTGLNETFYNVVTYELNTVEGSKVRQELINAIGKKNVTEQDVINHSLLSTSFQPEWAKSEPDPRYKINQAAKKYIATGKELDNRTITAIATELVDSHPSSKGKSKEWIAHEIQKLEPIVYGTIAGDGKSPVQVGLVRDRPLATSAGRVIFNAKKAIKLSDGTETDADGYYPIAKFKEANQHKDFFMSPTVKKIESADEMEKLVLGTKSGYSNDKTGDLTGKMYNRNIGNVVGATPGTFEPGYYMVYQYVEGGPIGAFKLKSDKASPSEVAAKLKYHLTNNLFEEALDQTPIWKRKYWDAINSFIKANRYHFFTKTTKNGVDYYTPRKEYKDFVGFDQKEVNGHPFLNFFMTMKGANESSLAAFSDHVFKFADAINKHGKGNPTMRDFGLLVPEEVGGVGSAEGTLMTNVKELNSPMMLVQGDTIKYGSKSSDKYEKPSESKKSEIEKEEVDDDGFDDDNESPFMAEIGKVDPASPQDFSKHDQVVDTKEFDDLSKIEKKDRSRHESNLMVDKFGSDSMINQQKAKLINRLGKVHILNSDYKKGSLDYYDSINSVYATIVDEARKSGVGEKEYPILMDGTERMVKISDMKPDEFIENYGHTAGLREDYALFHMSSPDMAAAMFKSIMPTLKIDVLNGNFKPIFKNIERYVDRDNMSEDDAGVNMDLIRKDIESINVGSNSVVKANELLNPFSSFSSGVKLLLGSIPFYRNRFSEFGDRVVKKTNFPLPERHAHVLLVEAAKEARSVKPGENHIERFGDAILRHAIELSSNGNTLTSDSLFSIYDHLFKRNEASKDRSDYSMLDYAHNYKEIIEAAKKGDMMIDGNPVSEAEMIAHIERKREHAADMLNALWSGFASISTRDYDKVIINNDERGDLSWIKQSERAEQANDIKNELTNAFLGTLTEPSAGGGMQMKQSIKARMFDTHSLVQYKKKGGKKFLERKNVTEEELQQMKDSPDIEPGSIIIKNGQFGAAENGYRVVTDGSKDGNGVYRIVKNADRTYKYEKIIEYRGKEIFPTAEYSKDEKIARELNGFFGISKEISNKTLSLYWSDKGRARNVVREAEEYVGRTTLTLDVSPDGFAKMQGSWFKSFTDMGLFENTMKTVSENKQDYADSLTKGPKDKDVIEKSAGDIRENEVPLPSAYFEYNRNLAILEGHQRGNGLLRHYYSVKRQRYYKDVLSTMLYDKLGDNKNYENASDLMSNEFVATLADKAGLQRLAGENADKYIQRVINAVSTPEGPIGTAYVKDGRVLNAVLDPLNKNVTVGNIVIFDGLERFNQGRGYTDMSPTEYYKVMNDAYMLNETLRGKDSNVNEIYVPLPTPADSPQPPIIKVKFENKNGKDARLFVVVQPKEINGVKEKGHINMNWFNISEHVWNNLQIRKGFQERSIDSMGNVLSQVLAKSKLVGSVVKKLNDSLKSKEFHDNPNIMQKFINDHINSDPKILADVMDGVRKNLEMWSDYVYDNEKGLYLGNLARMEFKDRSMSKPFGAKGQDNLYDLNLNAYNMMRKFLSEDTSKMGAREKNRRHMRIMKRMFSYGMKEYVDNLFESGYVLPKSAEDFSSDRMIRKKVLSDEQDMADVKKDGINGIYHSKDSQVVQQKDGSLLQVPYKYEIHPVIEAKFYSDLVSHLLIDDLVAGTPYQYKSSAEYYSRMYMTGSPGYKLSQDHYLGMAPSHIHLNIADEAIAGIQYTPFSHNKVNGEYVPYSYDLPKHLHDIESGINPVDGSSFVPGIVDFMRYKSLGGNYGMQNRSSLYGPKKPIYNHVDMLSGRSDKIKNSTISLAAYRKHSSWYNQLEQMALSYKTFIEPGSEKVGPDGMVTGGKEMVLYDKFKEFYDKDPDNADEMVVRWMADQPQTVYAKGVSGAYEPVSIHHTYISQYDPLSVKKSSLRKINMVDEDPNGWVPNEVFTNSYKTQLDVNKDFRQNDSSHFGQMQAEMSIGPNNAIRSNRMRKIMSDFAQNGIEELKRQAWDSALGKDGDYSVKKVEDYFRSIGMDAASAQGITSSFANAVRNGAINLNLPYVRDRLVSLVTNKLNEYIKTRHEGGSYVQNAGKFVDVWEATFDNPDNGTWAGLTRMSKEEIEWRASLEGLDPLAYATKHKLLRDQDGLSETKYYTEDGAGKITSLDEVAKVEYQKRIDPLKVELATKLAQAKAKSGNIKTKAEYEEMQKAFLEVDKVRKKIKQELAKLRQEILPNVKKVRASEVMSQFKNFDKFGFNEEGSYKDNPLHYKNARVYKMLSIITPKGVIRYDALHDSQFEKTVDDKSLKTVYHGGRAGRLGDMLKDKGIIGDVLKKENFDEQFVQSIEATTGRKFGEGADPLNVNDVIEHMEKFIKNLEVLYARVPTSTTASGGIGKIFEFIHDASNTMVMSSKKNALDNSDYDIDEVRVYTHQLAPKGSLITNDGIDATIKERIKAAIEQEPGAGPERQRQIQSAIESDFRDARMAAAKNSLLADARGYYHDPLNIDIITRPVMTAIIQDIISSGRGVNRSGAKPRLYTPNLNAKMHGLYMEGADTIGIFASSLKAYTRIYNAYLDKGGSHFNLSFKDHSGQINEYTKFTGVEGDGKNEDGDHTMIFISELLQAAVDNGKQLELAYLFANPTTANTISALAMVGMAPRKIIDIITSEHSKPIIESYIKSRNIDRTTVPLQKIIDAHEGVYNELSRGINDPKETNKNKIEAIQDVNKMLGVMIPYRVKGNEEAYKSIKDNKKDSKKGPEKPSLEIDPNEDPALRDPLTPDEFVDVNDYVPEHTYEQEMDGNGEISIVKKKNTIIDPEGNEYVYETDIDQNADINVDGVNEYIRIALDQISNLRTATLAGEAVRTISGIASINQGMKTTDYENKAYLRNYREALNPDMRFYDESERPLEINGKEVTLFSGRNLTVRSEMKRFQDEVNFKKRFIDIDRVVSKNTDLASYIDVQKNYEAASGKVFLFDNPIIKDKINKSLSDIMVRGIRFENEHRAVKKTLEQTMVAMYLAESLSSKNMSMKRAADGSMADKTINLGDPHDRVSFMADVIDTFSDLLETGVVGKRPADYQFSDMELAKMKRISDNKLLKNLRVITSRYGNKRLELRDSTFMSDELKASIEADIENLNRDGEEGLVEKLVAYQMISNSLGSGKGSLAEMINVKYYKEFSDWMNMNMNELDRGGKDSDFSARIKSYMDQWMISDNLIDMIPSVSSKKSPFKGKVSFPMTENSNAMMSSFNKPWATINPGVDPATLPLYIKERLTLEGRGGSNQYIMKLNTDKKTGITRYDIVGNMYTSAVNNIHPGAETFMPLFKFMSLHELRDLQDNKGTFTKDFMKAKSFEETVYILGDGSQAEISSYRGGGNSGKLMIKPVNVEREGSNMADIRVSEFTQNHKEAFEGKLHADLLINKIKSSFPNVTIRSVNNKEMMRDVYPKSKETDWNMEDVPYARFNKHGEVLVNTEKASMRAPVHEYVHVWGRLLKGSNPELYAKLIEKADGITVDHGSGANESLKDVLKRTNAYKGESAEMLAEEALAFYAGAVSVPKIKRMLNRIDLENTDKLATDLYDSSRELFDQSWEYYEGKFNELFGESTVESAKHVSEKGLAEIMDTFVNAILRGEKISDVTSAQLSGVKRVAEMKELTKPPQENSGFDFVQKEKAEILKRIDNGC